MTTINQNLARNLRQLRQARGWSIARLAKECEAVGAAHLTESSLGNIERGQDPNAVRAPRLVTAGELFVFAELFNVPIDVLVGHAPCAGCNDEPPPGFTCNSCGVSVQQPAPIAALNPKENR